MKNLQTFHSNFFIGQCYFNTDGSQFFLMFQPTIKACTNFFGSLDKVSGWESKELLNEEIKLPLTADKIISSKLAWINKSSIILRFEASFLTQKFPTFTPKP